MRTWSPGRIPAFSTSVPEAVEYATPIAAASVIPSLAGRATTRPAGTVVWSA